MGQYASCVFSCFERRIWGKQGGPLAPKEELLCCHLLLPCPEPHGKLFSPRDQDELVGVDIGQESLVLRSYTFGLPAAIWLATIRT